MDAIKTTTESGKSKMNLRSKRALIGWTVLACVAISVAAYFLVVSPQWQRVGPGRELDIAALEETQQARDRYLTQLKTLKANYEKISQTDIALLARALPTTQAVPELIQQLEAMGRESGLEVASVNIAEVSEARGGSTKQQLQQEVSGGAAKAVDKSVKQLNVQLQVNTDRYDRFRQFLSALQTNDRILDIDSYLFASDQDVQSISVKTYYLQAK